MRSRLMLVWTSLAVGCCVSVGISDAKAQAWLADRRRSEGIGIRAGNLEIHPGLGTEVGYDSNVFNADSELTAGSDNDRLPVGSAILRVAPHLALSTLGAQRREGDPSSAERAVVEFRGGASAPIYVYFSTPQRTRLEANVDLDLQLLPSRPVSFGLVGQYTRTGRPFAQGPGSLNYGRNTLEASPQVNLQTTGGVLKASVGGILGYAFFDSSALSIYDYLSYTVKATSSWEFLPKSALVYEADLSWRDYQNEATETTGEGASIRNDGRRYQFRGGFNGALTAWISVTAMAGYAAAFFDSGPVTDDLLAMLELRWKASDSSMLSFGYDRSLTAAFQGNYHRSDRFSAKAQVLLGGVFLLGGDVGLGLVQYGLDRRTNMRDPEPRSDQRLSAQVTCEYRLTDWFAFTANGGVIVNMTDFENQTATGTEMLFDPAEFNKMEAFLGARLFY